MWDKGEWVIVKDIDHSFICVDYSYAMKYAPEPLLTRSLAFRVESNQVSLVVFLNITVKEWYPGKFNEVLVLNTLRYFP